MPDEVVTEIARSDAPSADESLFGDAAEDAPAAVAGKQVSTEETDQEGQGPEDTGTHGSGEEAAQSTEPVTEAGEPDAVGETDASEKLKVVVSIKGGKAIIGVQQPSSDPHIESFDGQDLPVLAQEVTAVVERARARWEESPKHPAYERPAPPARRRNRRQQGTAQEASAETQASETETQQQTLRLF